MKPINYYLIKIRGTKSIPKTLVNLRLHTFALVIEIVNVRGLLNVDKKNQEERGTHFSTTRRSIQSHPKLVRILVESDSLETG